MSESFGIIDLFAGPGGLGEGFATFETGGRNPFRIGISVEKEASAHQTLRLRAFLREYRRGHGHLPAEFVAFHAGRTPEPDWPDIDADAWGLACAEARKLELGTAQAADAIDQAIDRMRRQHDDTILIGGPPCQAYSLVGRARARGNADYIPEEDGRHYLFREYIRVLKRLEPAAFVMENVKGMLSSTVESRRVFEMLMEDLASLGQGRGHRYVLRALRVEDGMARLHHHERPADFVVRAEEFGVPQRRHRVIIIGIRADLAPRADRARIAVLQDRRTVDETIGTMPELRSGISRGKDDAAAWKEHVLAAARQLSRKGAGLDEGLRDEFAALADRIATHAPMQRSASALPRDYGQSTDPIMQWIERPELQALAQHETRGHMAADLGRYLFAATFAKMHQRSPKAADFPECLAPDHRNWQSGIFSDRFRVQLADEPSTTVTSHISKDGHYFIHHDPVQCRSLTVREAARLQTFPDDYLFLGRRADQHVQVGNAVPSGTPRSAARRSLNRMTRDRRMVRVSAHFSRVA